MNIKLTDDGLILIPDTDFEIEYIKSFAGIECKVYVKTGLCITDIVGLKIDKLNKGVEKRNEEVKKRK